MHAVSIMQNLPSALTFLLSILGYKTLLPDLLMRRHIIILGWIKFQIPVLVVLHISMHSNWDLQCYSISICGKFLVLSLVCGGTSSDRGMFKLDKLLFLILVLGIRLMQ